MNAFLTLINIIVLVIFIVILHMMARKHISFAKRVFTALGIGIVFGVLLHLVYGTHSNVLHQQVTGSTLSDKVTLHCCK